MVAVLTFSGALAIAASDRVPVGIGLFVLCAIVRTGIIYVGELDSRISREDYFDFVIPFEDLLAP